MDTPRVKDRRNCNQDPKPDGEREIQVQVVLGLCELIICEFGITRGKKPSNFFPIHVLYRTIQYKGIQVVRHGIVS